MLHVLVIADNVRMGYPAVIVLMGTIFSHGTLSVNAIQLPTICKIAKAVPSKLHVRLVTQITLSRQ